MEALVLVPLLIWGMVALLSLLASVFWLWMLVDCAMNEPDDTDKIVWVLIILFTSLIGALAYYFLRRPQRQSGDVGSAVRNPGTLVQQLISPCQRRPRARRGRGRRDR